MVRDNFTLKMEDVIRDSSIMTNSKVMESMSQVMDNSTEEPFTRV